MERVERHAIQLDMGKIRMCGCGQWRGRLPQHSMEPLHQNAQQRQNRQKFRVQSGLHTRRLELGALQAQGCGQRRSRDMESPLEEVHADATWLRVFLASFIRMWSRMCVSRPKCKELKSKSRSSIDDFPSWMTWEKFRIQEVVKVAASACDVGSQRQSPPPRQEAVPKLWKCGFTV